MTILQMNSEDRPREKMLDKGAKALTAKELLAILIGSGSIRRSALELAGDILDEVDGRISMLSGRSVDSLMRFYGIGKAKAITIAAAMELGRRALSEESIPRKIPVQQPEQIYRIMLPEVRNIDHEQCWVLYLNRSNYLISKEMITRGGSDSTLFDIKYIVKKVIEKQAASVILVHNHPSGNPVPGKSDIQATKALKKALDTFNVSLLDHIVIAESSFFSFHDEKTYSFGP